MGRRRSAAPLSALAATCLLALRAVAAPPVHWAFEPPSRPTPPRVERGDLVRTGIDLFIESALEKAGLTLGPEASREALARRVSFDLLGLPPEPADVEAFVSDSSPEAYERLVDRLLASARYGERWGRHWLDAAGYADSNGYFSADSDRPLAYKYRDYVVSALDADRPLQRFLEEQLAGDELAGYDPDGDVSPEMADLLAATHFLRNSQDGTGESDGNEVEVLVDKTSVIEGTVQIIGSSLLGLTLQCARCHDHKFDPITQADYFSLQAIFTSAYAVKKWQKPQDRSVTVGSRGEKEAHRQATRKVELEIEARKSSLDGFVAPLRRLLQREKAAALPEAERTELEKVLETPKNKRDEKSTALLKKHEKVIEVSDEEIDKRFEDAGRTRAGVAEAVARLEKEKPAPLERVSVLVDTDPDPPPHHILTRGLVTDPGAEVAPAVPALLDTPTNSYALDPRSRPGRSSGRRLAFARWLTSEENPLVPRVTVNRIWQHHFGVGIVSTPENFGTTGAKPTHPELLDHLVDILNRSGGSLKALHREIVTSAVYRQSSAPRKEGIASDPDVRLLWRFPLRRLDAEALRDAMLAASGRLDLRKGGPYVATTQGEDGQVLVDEKKDGAFRRSIYLQQRRTQPVTQLEVFDAPLIVASCTRRSLSTTPLQSLAMLNSSFSLGSARALASRVAADAGGARDARVDRVYRIAFGHAPSPEEARLGQEFLTSQSSEYAPDANGGDRALSDFCQICLSSNAFLYVE